MEPNNYKLNIIIALLIQFLIFSISQHTDAQSWVASINPARNQLNVNKSANISIVFNRAINPSTLSNSTIKLSGTQHGFYNGVNFLYNTATRTLTFNANTIFKVGENINVILTRNIRDSVNNQMPTPFIWGFTIQATSGTGLFDHFSQLPVSSVPQTMECEDFDNDGDLDIVVATWQSNNLNILKNDGTGNFTITQTLYGVINPRGITSGDVDGDMDIDLIATDETNDYIYEILNGGTGNFVIQNVIINPGDHPVPLSLNDIDGDGDLDLIVGNWNSQMIAFFKNNGTGGFTLYSMVNPGIRPLATAVGDFDGDNDLDVAVGIDWSPPLIAILNNDGNGNFTLGTSYLIQDRPYSIITNDIDADGDLDIIDANLYYNTLTVLRNNGTGNFNLSFIPTGGNWGSNLAEADFDHDGDIDLLLCNRMSPNFSVFNNSGNGIFTLNLIPHNDGGAFQLIKGDFDADGDIDFAVTNFTMNSISIYKNRDPFGITPISNQIPEEFKLYQNFPNPFNPSTTIRFDIPVSSHAKLTLYDVLGREVGVILDEYLVGQYSINWDASAFTSGIFFYSLRAKEFESTKKMVLMK